MRYFKYDGPSPDIVHLKEKNKHLSKKERWGKFLGKLGTPLFFIALVGLMVGSFWLLGRIPQPIQLLWEILLFLVKIPLYFLTVILCAAGAALVAMPFWNMRDAAQKKARQRLLSESCEYLRTFYQLQEPCVVTKCYESHDKRFVDHDVCLFFVDGELRITTNLKNGFLRHSKDLGCYALKREEFTVSATSYKEKVATEITAGDTRFLLGRRAKSFLENTDCLSGGEQFKTG